MTRGEILLSLKEILADETGKAVAELDETQSFHSLGLDSISIIVILDILENQYAIAITPLHFWDYPTLGVFTDFIMDELKKHEQS